MSTLFSYFKPVQSSSSEKSASKGSGKKDSAKTNSSLVKNEEQENKKPISEIATPPISRKRPQLQLSDEDSEGEIGLRKVL